MQDRIPDEIESQAQSKKADGKFSVYVINRGVLILVRLVQEIGLAMLVECAA